MITAYKIYSIAAHAEWHAVVQGWRQEPSPGGPCWERWPDQEAVWAMVLSAAGLATMPAFRTLTLLGWIARLVELFLQHAQGGRDDTAHEATARVGLLTPG